MMGLLIYQVKLTKWRNPVNIALLRFLTDFNILAFFQIFTQNNLTSLEDAQTGNRLTGDRIGELAEKMAKWKIGWLKKNDKQKK